MKTNFRSLLVLGSGSMLALTSCDKLKDELFPAFNTQMAAVNITIPITVQGTETGTSSTVSFNLDSTIKAYTENTFSIDNLSSVKVKDIGIILNEEYMLGDLSNFETVSVALESNTNTTPAVVASATIPNTPAYSLNIPASNSPELKDYLRGNQLTYTIRGKARKTTTTPMRAAVSITLSVK